MYLPELQKNPGLCLYMSVCQYICRQCLSIMFMIKMVSCPGDEYQLFQKNPSSYPSNQVSCGGGSVLNLFFVFVILFGYTQVKSFCFTRRMINELSNYKSIRMLIELEIIWGILNRCNNMRTFYKNTQKILREISQSKKNSDLFLNGESHCGDVYLRVAKTVKT